MIDIDLLNNSIVFPEAIEITTPFNGFTRYLMQSKARSDYMKSDMSKNFIFYEPMNKQVFKIFSNCKEDREAIFKEWNHYLLDNTLYICQNVEFVNEDINDFFMKPNYELAVFLQSIANEIIKQNKDFDICIGVVHGEQLTNEGIRYPHAHILLKRKENICQIGLKQ